MNKQEVRIAPGSIEVVTVIPIEGLTTRYIKVNEQYYPLIITNDVESGTHNSVFSTDKNLRCVICSLSNVVSSSFVLPFERIDNAFLMSFFSAA